MITFANEIAELAARADDFAKMNPVKAARNLGNAEVFIVTDEANSKVYPIYWLLHVRKSGAFDDNKRSNQSLDRFRPSLREAGFIEVSEGHQRFQDAWGILCNACETLGTTPSRRTRNPDWHNRRFFMPPPLISSSYSGKVSDNFQDEVKASLKLSQTARLARLSRTSPQPATYTLTIEKHARNADVVAHRLELSKGICGACNKRGPFISQKTGLPFLEVHHIQPLGEGGPDTVENTIALCPNCHRKAHFG